MFFFVNFHSIETCHFIEGKFLTLDTMPRPAMQPKLTSLTLDNDAPPIPPTPPTPAPRQLATTTASPALIHDPEEKDATEMRLRNENAFVLFFEHFLLYIL